MNHSIFNISLEDDIPQNCKRLVFGMGCFWGAERVLWKTKGVYRTAVGYAGGTTESPNYNQVCTTETGHAEVVEVIYQPEIISLDELLKVFWEGHNPTQGMGQGNDRGSQYRSMIVCYDHQQYQVAKLSLDKYQTQLSKDGFSEITTEILTEQTFYIAEEEHQQYLDKNPQGYCGIGGTGTCFID